MKLTQERLFAMIVNTLLYEEELDLEASFDEMFYIAMNWANSDDLGIATSTPNGKDVITKSIVVNKTHSLTQHRDGSLQITGSLPIPSNFTLEDEGDIMMTALTMAIWIVQPEYDEEEKEKGKLGRGILPFDKFDLRGFEDNRFKIEDRLKEWGISKVKVKFYARKFDAWQNKKEKVGA